MRLTCALPTRVLSSCEPERNQQVRYQHETQRPEQPTQFIYAHRLCHYLL